VHSPHPRIASPPSFISCHSRITSVVTHSPPPTLMHHHTHVLPPLRCDFTHSSPICKDLGLGESFSKCALPTRATLFSHCFSKCALPTYAASFLHFLLTFALALSRPLPLAFLSHRITITTSPRIPLGPYALPAMYCPSLLTCCHMSPLHLTHMLHTCCPSTLAHASRSPHVLPRT
jgi:hypothetical protein